MKKTRIFRLPVLLLIAALLLGLCSCVANTTLVIGGDDTNEEQTDAPEANGGTFQYKINDAGYYEIIGYTPGSTDIVDITIPESIGGIDVTSIAADAFAACTYISGITIPSTVLTIGDSAFRECTYLESIVIPESVTSIGNGLFSKCISLTSVTLPSSLTAIPAHTFSGCSSLASYPISEKITVIGAGAFRDCTALTSVVIPATVEKIGAQAYYNCSNLAYFEMNAILDFILAVDDNGAAIYDDNGYRIVDEELSTIGEYMLYRFAPDAEIVYDAVNNIGMEAYYNYYELDKEPPSLEEETTASASVVG